MGKTYQQGDVLLRPVTALPKDASIAKAPRVVAEGELTGHAHRLSDGNVMEYGADRYVVIPEGGATLAHEEHHGQLLPPGIYKVGSVVEYDPLTDMVRKVLD